MERCTITFNSEDGLLSKSSFTGQHKVLAYKWLFSVHIVGSVITGVYVVV